MIPLPSIRINYICIISVMHYLIFIGVDPASTQKLEKLPLISIAQNQSCVHHNALKEHVNNLVEGALSLLWYINELLMFREALWSRGIWNLHIWMLFLKFPYVILKLICKALMKPLWNFGCSLFPNLRLCNTWFSMAPFLVIHTVYHMQG